MHHKYAFKVVNTRWKEQRRAMDFSHWSSFTLPTVLKKLKLKGCEREDMETGNTAQEKRDTGKGGETRKNKSEMQRNSISYSWIACLLLGILLILGMYRYTSSALLLLIAIIFNEIRHYDVTINCVLAKCSKLTKGRQKTPNGISINYVKHRCCM